MQRRLPIVIALLWAGSQPLPAQESIEYQKQALTPAITMISARGGNIAVSAGDDGVFLIDDQMKPFSEELLTTIREISDAPIRFVINTHYHFDHTGGNEVMDGEGAVIVAHDKLRERMTVDVFNPILRQTFPAAAPNELPDLTFSDRVTLHLNGEAVTAHHVPRGHTDGDAIVHFTGSNVLHMGDIYFNGLYPFIDLDAGGTIQGTISAVDKGLELADENTKVIPGHGPLASRQDLQTYGDFLVSARDRVQALIDSGSSLEQAIVARPTSEWDATLGAVWITPEQFVTFIYNSLVGVDHYTTPDGKRVRTE